MNEKLNLVITVVVAIALAGGVTWYYAGQKRSAPEFSPQASTVPTSTVTTPDATSTVNWQTYRNEQYGLELKYPEDWYVSDSMGNIGRRSVVFGNVKQYSDVSDKSLQNEALLRISVRNSMPGLEDDQPANPEVLPIDKWFDRYFSKGFPTEPISKKNVSVGGHPAIQIVVSEVGGHRVHTYVAYGRDVIEVEYQLFQQKFLTSYEKMVSTIQFTK